ncbi:MAG: SpoVR family protein [Planctomycetota bacterium]
MAAGRSLSPFLAEQAQSIEVLARAAGLDPFDVVFEMLDAKDVNAVAAYGGFPVRYPSWRFGMDYERLEKGHRFGLSKIYELVINNDPTYAYLVRTNSDMEQKLVMAHVYGHGDFFKNNIWFAPTERRMLDQSANHGTRLRRYIDVLGQDKVETFLDLALSLDNLVDPFLPLREHLQGKRNTARGAGDPATRRTLDSVLDGVPDPTRITSAHLPTYDVLGFLVQRAPLEAWQRDVVRIVRAEAYYFMPQRMTKIMNEGWASFWHSRLLTGGVLESAEVIDFADCHSGATAAPGGQLNPYKLGIDLYRHAEEKGFDLFRLRRVHNDASFIDEIVDEEFAAKSELFLFGKNSRTGRTEVVDRGWRHVKERLLQELAWGGLPQIELVGDDGEGRGELVFEHHHDGRDLQLAHAGETLKNLAKLWQRPVHLVTLEDGVTRRLTSDGEYVKSIDITPANAEA